MEKKAIEIKNHCFTNLLSVLVGEAFEKFEMDTPEEYSSILQFASRLFSELEHTKDKTQWIPPDAYELDK